MSPPSCRAFGKGTHGPGQKEKNEQKVKTEAKDNDKEDEDVDGKQLATFSFAGVSLLFITCLF
jgi:hypothetical protein